MRFFALVSAAAVPLAVTAVHLGGHARRHHDLAARNPQPQNLTERSDFEKRDFSGRFTFYDVGLGACGETNVASDYIVALNSDQYGSGYPGPYCFKSITINYDGKSAQATIMDECPGCPYGGLDFSRGLFDHFASEDVGVLYGTWYFNDDSSSSGGDSGDSSSSSSKKTTSTHKTTSTPSPSPTTTWTPQTTSTKHSTTSSSPSPTPTPTSTQTPTSTSHRTHSTSSSSATPSTTSTVTSTSSINISSGVASGLAQTTGAITPSATGSSNLDLLSSAIVYLGALVASGAQAASN